MRTRLYRAARGTRQKKNSPERLGYFLCQENFRLVSSFFGASAAAAGFWVGLAADLDLADPAAWLASPEASADPVTAFFDLAAAEN